ncbi:pyruvate dehydrogenase complex dihydrolipoamide acetyltransferase [Ferruginibacter sp.]|uniref:pyruvate dehydrogenase complex dihydrolipoamide acetyltransferase n=1 Tax=Ferruginibacter sp. TaxID=1940288 RepID=UPI0019A11EF6|nr:pyruvate dehydrogenase complex dihydrolipoamide acetyltransferase [Ferruginibacter sp.]MBC7626992.1 pyruvate dehydrogenase complex dihydrolipoamide acetyltransferase [Ferruginibacter sp.]
MAEVIRMPLLSDTMTEGKIVAWNKKVGDKVKADDVLADVETDKATMEVNGYVDGTLLYIGVPEGEAAKINQIIAIVGKEGEDYKALLDDEKAKPTTEDGPQTTEKTADDGQQTIKQTTDDGQQTTNPQLVPLPEGAKEIRMPLLSDTMTEGKIVAWNKNVGDIVKADDVLADVETDKATMEVVGYEEGTLLYIGVEAGQAAKINQIIAIVGKAGTDVAAYVAAEKAMDSAAGTTASVKTTDEGQHSTKQTTDNGQPTTVAAPPTTTPQPETNNPQPVNNTDGRIKASPLAKKIAAEKGLDISKISGTGDGGRITKSDIEGYKEKTTDDRPQTTIATASAQPSTINYQPSTESYTDVPLTQMRKVIARRLGESMFTAPHFYLTMELNMDNAMAARIAINEVSPVKVSFNDMIIKACAAALRLHPDVNSSWMGDFIRKNNHIHIGSALALPEGLIVPVIKFADQKSLSQIAAAAKELYAKAKDKKLQPNEFSGNTFTISNLGMMDIEEFTAIINPPDSCILAVGKIKETVVSRNGKFETANVMKVTLSCDHRSVDGAVGAAFLQTLKKFVENPVTMLV